MPQKPSKGGGTACLSGFACFPALKAYSGLRTAVLWMLVHTSFPSSFLRSRHPRSRRLATCYKAAGRWVTAAWPRALASLWRYLLVVASFRELRLLCCCCCCCEVLGLPMTGPRVWGILEYSHAKSVCGDRRGASSCSVGLLGNTAWSPVEGQLSRTSKREGPWPAVAPLRRQRAAAPSMRSANAPQAAAMCTTRAAYLERISLGGVIVVLRVRERLVSLLDDGLILASAVVAQVLLGQRAVCKGGDQGEAKAFGQGMLCTWERACFARRLLVCQGMQAVCGVGRSVGA